MKKGVIIINAYANIPAQKLQATRLLDEFKQAGNDVYIAKSNDYRSFIGKDGKVHTKYAGLDFVVFLDRDKYLPRIFEREGLRVFNCAESIEICDDKMLTHLALCGEIPQPKTMPAPRCYTLSAKILKSEAERVVAEMGLPIVVKESSGNRGKGVYLVNSVDELLKVMNDLKGRSYIFQEYIASSYGKDMRLVVIGGKVFTAMIRQSNNDFRSNIDLGGVGTPVEPDGKFIGVAEKCAKILKLDYAGVDILFGDSGAPIVAEVNSNAFFKEMERVTGKNVAGEYVKHILNVLEK